MANIKKMWYEISNFQVIVLVSNCCQRLLSLPGDMSKIATVHLVAIQVPSVIYASRLIKL
ncbi:hypothetical protein D9M69_671550 [compost metagenome]